MSICLNSNVISGLSSSPGGALADVQGNIVGNLADEIQDQIGEYTSGDEDSKETLAVAGGIILGASAAAGDRVRFAGVPDGQVLLALEVNMNLRDIEGEEEEFKAGVTQDVATAVDGDITKIRVLKLEAGSIWVYMAIEEGVCPDRCALDVATEVKEQAEDPTRTSALLQCLYTHRTISAHVSVAEGSQRRPCQPVAPDAVLELPISMEGTHLRGSNPVFPMGAPGTLARLWDADCLSRDLLHTNTSMKSLQRRAEWLDFIKQDLDSFSVGNPPDTLNPTSPYILSPDKPDQTSPGSSDSMIPSSPMLSVRFPWADVSVSPDCAAEARIDLSHLEPGRVSQVAPGVFREERFIEAPET